MLLLERQPERSAALPLVSRPNEGGLPPASGTPGEARTVITQHPAGGGGGSLSQYPALMAEIGRNFRWRIWNWEVTLCHFQPGALMWSRLEEGKRGLIPPSSGRKGSAWECLSRPAFGATFRANGSQAEQEGNSKLL